MKLIRTLLSVGLISLVPSIVWAQINFNSYPSRIVGQPLLQQLVTPTAVGVNFVEGREFFSPQGIAVDTSATPPILYVADTGNNRVLAWANALSFTNGAYADKIIGQRDRYTISPKGPGTDLTFGLYSPTGLAVDKSGNLYVVDSGNNRILRYPKPLSQTGALLAADLVIGQRDYNGRSANEGNLKPTAVTLALSSNAGIFRAGIAFDTLGNLWVSDPANNRVLRFKASDLTAGNNEPAADLVLGQFDFTTNTLPAQQFRNLKTFINAPSGLALDPQNRLFVTDQANGVGRVLVFTPPYSSGQSAARIMGLVLPSQTQPNPPQVSAATLGVQLSNGQTYPPEAVFFIGNNPFVLDRGNARILEYPPFDQWPIECTPTQTTNCGAGTAFSPSAIAVIGQTDFITDQSNQGQPQPSAMSLSGPVRAHNLFEVNGALAAVFAANQLYVADTGNNRVLVFPQQAGGTFGAATGVLGQVDFRFNAPNLIEGKEFFFQQIGASVVVDPNSNPPHLYVSDPGNNRILGFKDYRAVGPGTMADLVIGQPDFFTSMQNYPKNDPTQTNDMGLATPEGLAVDKNGDLYVADAGNGRVVRFARPFDQPPGMPHANLVLGQGGFFQKLPDISAATMSQPVGIAFTADGHLLVSDSGFNRILLFRRPSGGDFTNSQTAANVVGQPDFITTTENTLKLPRLIAVDSDDHLYVADSGNNRILVYPDVNTAATDPVPSFALTCTNNSCNGPALMNPFGVTVDPTTGEIWVADTSNNRVLRFPRFAMLVTSTTPTVIFPTSGPLAVGLDPFGNPLVAESINRISFYYPSMDVTNAAGGVLGRFSGNAANYFQRFAPGMLASIFSYPNTHFGTDTATFSSVPLPTTLADVQVLVNGVAAPLLYAAPGQINFQVPSSAPVQSTPIEFQVLKASTGQVIASALFRIEPASPGLFSADGTGCILGPCQLAVLNQDGSVNSASKPAKAGTVVTFFGTGAGVVQGAPPDGTPVPAGTILTTDVKPDVYINAMQLSSADVLFSGLAPGLIGVWQVNAKVPMTVPTPDQQVPVAIVFQGINSRLDQGGNGRTTYIRTTP